ncbi:MAG: hypothetical protein P4N59_24095 [Negativicutes bacterium]|nr:hypothetical protein [Negativicutes bacterium]
MLFILNDREVFSLFSTGSVESVVFEESDKSDFSSGGKYLKLNKIVRGSVSTAEGKSERAERYYCSFVEMRSGCIVKEGTGEFCGGHWGEDDGEWMAEGELTTIDVRKSGSRAALEIDTYFKNFSNRENYQRCLSQWRGAAQRVPTVQ